MKGSGEKKEKEKDKCALWLHERESQFVAAACDL